MEPSWEAPPRPAAPETHWHPFPAPCGSRRTPDRPSSRSPRVDPCLRWPRARHLGIAANSSLRKDRSSSCRKSLTVFASAAAHLTPNRRQGAPGIRRPAATRPPSTARNRPATGTRPARPRATFLHLPQATSVPGRTRPPCPHEIAR